MSGVVKKSSFDHLRNRSKEMTDLVVLQMKNYWSEIDEMTVKDAVPMALDAVEENFWGLPSKRFFDKNEVIFRPYFTIHWMIFLYRLSKQLYENGGGSSADQVYYLNKIMHSNDWFYGIDLPKHFLCEHPLGSVLGRAQYGDHFFVYQGTTVGGNRKGERIMYPQIGNNVVLFANSTVLGNTQIGDNVLVSSDSYLINETIPDNCIVFGRSPNIVIKEKCEEEIKDYTNHIWGWN